MLETPLYGRFQGENRRLAFLAPTPYLVLVRGCMIGGALGIVYGMLIPVLGLDAPFYPNWWIGTGAMVLGAGVLAAMSLQSIIFDLKEKVYRRRQGPGTFVATRHGKIQDLDAIVLIAEPDPLVVANGVTYHLVLHWKGMADSPMVLQSDTRRVPPGNPIQIGAQPLLQQGMRYAQAMGIPFYDNSHFASKNPVPVL